MDVLSDILSAMRLTGGVIIDAELRGDWSIDDEFRKEDCEQFFPVTGSLISYHFVRSGKLWAQVGNQPPAELGPGCIVVFPQNARHRLFTADVPSVDGSSIVLPADNGQQARVRIDGPGDPVQLYCGFLSAAGTDNPLLDQLPSMLVLSPESNARSEWVGSSMRFASEELHSAPPMLIGRLAELMFGEAVRAYLESNPESGEWIAGLKDPAVGRALAIIHSRYAEELEVEQLAREAGVSRTVLGERFVELLGEPPMRYCARWRMRVAANLLREGRESTANIAYSVGFNSEAAFNRAFKREYGEPPATWRRRVESEEKTRQASVNRELPPQRIAFCSAHDGTRLAYSVTGEGPALVKCANWLNHLEFDWDSPLWRHWLHELTGHHRLVRYDERGNGLSDWDTPEISFDAFVDDLACVADAVGFERFDLLGISQGAAVAVAYAVRFPQRVRRMVLFGGYACGWRVRGDPIEIEQREAMMTLARTGWGSDNPAYRQLFTSRFIPNATPEQMRWFNDMQRESASPENAVRLLQTFSGIDVRDLLPRVTAPTLVIHNRGDGSIPCSEGERLAAGIPGARLRLLDSHNHLLVEHEPAWGVFKEEVRSFLGSA